MLSPLSPNNPRTRCSRQYLLAGWRAETGPSTLLRPSFEAVKPGDDNSCRFTRELIHMTVTVNLWMSAMKKSKVFGIVLLAVAPVSLVGGAVFRNPYPVLVAMAGLGLVPLASKLATGADTWDEAVEHRRARNRAGGSWPHDLTWLAMAIFAVLWLMDTVAMFLEQRSAASYFLRTLFASGPAWVRVADLLFLAGGAFFVMLSLGLPVVTMLGAWRRTRWGQRDLPKTSVG